MSIRDLADFAPLLIGERAWEVHQPVRRRSASAWEVWGRATAAPARCRLTRDGPVAAGEAGDGQVAYRWATATGELVVRLWQDGMAGALFHAANAEDGAVLADAPCGRIRVARPTTLLLIDRATLVEPGGWYARMQRFHARQAQFGREAAAPLEHAAHARHVEEIAARSGTVHAVSMRSPNAEFFGGFKHAAIRLYEHDDLHGATCYHDAPLYYTIKDDPGLAYIPRRNFERLVEADRLRLVREECYAIALERVVVPARFFGMSEDPQRAYLYALHRVCTDLATGWFRDFAIEHFPELARTGSDYVGRFDAAVESGQVRRKVSPPESDEVRQALADNLRRVQSRRELAGLTGQAWTDAAERTAASA